MSTVRNVVAYGLGTVALQKLLSLRADAAAEKVSVKYRTSPAFNPQNDTEAADAVFVHPSLPDAVRESIHSTYARRGVPTYGDEDQLRTFLNLSKEDAVAATANKGSGAVDSGPTDPGEQPKQPDADAGRDGADEAGQPGTAAPVKPKKAPKKAPKVPGK